MGANGDMNGEVSAETLALMQRLMVNVLAERAATARRLGLQFGGLRDVYEAAGYDKVISADKYSDRFERQDIANRIVNAPADETWRLAPQIRDGTEWEKGAVDTEFVRAWRALADGGALLEDGETATGALHYLHRVDRLAGIGQYGVLLLGLRGDDRLDTPLRQGTARGTNDLIYLAAFEEQTAAITTTVADINNRRFGLPEYYTLQTNQQSLRTHWSRTLHIAERPRSDEIYGTPRLRACWNRLMDLEKILPASGEAAWKLLDAGQIISTRDGYELPSDSAALQTMKDEITEFMHNLRRFLLMEGIEASPVSGQMTDPTGLVRINVALISAATGIPQRILLGAEAGELASSQDERNWTKQIEARQEQFAEPMILRPFINRLIWAGVLPAPQSGTFVVHWPDLMESDQGDEAKTADTAASALQRLQIIVDAQEFVRAYMPQLPAAAVRGGTQQAGGEVTAANAVPFRDYP